MGWYGAVSAAVVGYWLGIEIARYLLGFLFLGAGAGAALASSCGSARSSDRSTLATTATKLNGVAEGLTASRRGPSSRPSGRFSLSQPERSETHMNSRLREAVETRPKRSEKPRISFARRRSAVVVNSSGYR